MNLGLSDKLKTEFKDFMPVERPVIYTENISDPAWISGFVTGEGNFDVIIVNSTNKIGKRVQLRFRIVQHERDLNLMELIIQYLGCGRIEYDNRKEHSVITIVVGNFKDLHLKIIPFFIQNHIKGIKYLDYLDWCKIAELVSLGKHKTDKGLLRISEIIKTMNSRRQIFIWDHLKNFYNINN